jgi:hypothetical protein
MRAKAFVMGLGIAAATLIVAPAAQAYPGPYGGNCETTQQGAVFCDGNVQPNGGWTRCYPIPQSVNYQCLWYDPAAPPTQPLGQPNHHIDAAAPTARADSYTFLVHAHQANITMRGGDAELVNMAQLGCEQLDKGYSPNDVASMVLNEGDLDAYQAGEFVSYSARDLCPQHVGEVARWAYSRS